MKLGIGTYCYMWAIGFAGARPAQPMTAFDLLQRAHDLGVQVVQYGPNLPLTDYTAADLDRLAAQARDWRIELELGTRGLETDHLTAQIALAKRLGSCLLRTVPEIGGQTPDIKSIPAYLRQILPLLENEGIKLGLENGKIPADPLGDLLDDMASPYLGIVLDSVNSLAVAEGWKYVTERLAQYTVCLHVKDFVVKRAWHMMGFIIEGAPAGQGQLDIPWLLNKLGESGPLCNAILELWPPEQKTIEETIALEDKWVVESIPYLRDCIRG